MWVEDFSSGYYLTQAIVEPGADVPQVNDEDYREIQFEIFTNGDGIGSILFQIDQLIMCIEPSRGVPTNVLMVPKGIIEKMTVGEPPAKREIYIPKPWMYQYLKEPQ